jgi:SAM-dependent methyltransferase
MALEHRLSAAFDPGRDSARALWRALLAERSTLLTSVPKVFLLKLGLIDDPDKNNTSRSDAKPTYEPASIGGTEPPVLPEREKEKIAGFLDEYDLTDEHLRLTQESYRAESKQYSELEWSDRSIKISLEHILPGMKMTEGQKVLYGGAGTNQLGEMIATIYNAQVFSFDLEDSMLNIARERLELDEIMYLMYVIATAGKAVNWPVPWVQNLIDSVQRTQQTLEEAVAAMRRNTIGDDTDEDDTNVHSLDDVYFKQRIIRLVNKAIDRYVSIEELRKRIYINQGRLETPNQVFYPEQDFDRAMVVAAFQHLPKEVLIPSLKDFVKLLKPGGLFYFNLRSDLVGIPHPEHGIPFGRVAFDYELGKDNVRFMNTVTTAELTLILEFLKAELQQEGIEIAIEQTEGTAHHNPDKAGFFNIYVTRLN